MCLSHFILYAAEVKYKSIMLSIVGRINYHVMTKHDSTDMLYAKTDFCFPLEMRYSYRETLPLFNLHTMQW